MLAACIHALVGAFTHCTSSLQLFSCGADASGVSVLTRSGPSFAAALSSTAARDSPWRARAPKRITRARRSTRSAGEERAKSGAMGKSEAIGARMMIASRMRQGLSTKRRRSCASSRLTMYSAANTAMIAHSAIARARSSRGGSAKSIGASPAASAASARKPIRASFRTREAARSTRRSYGAGVKENRGQPPAYSAYGIGVRALFSDQFETLRFQHRGSLRRCKELDQRLSGIRLRAGREEPDREGGDLLQLAGERPDEIDAVHCKELGDLLDGEIGFALH